MVSMCCRSFPAISRISPLSFLYLNLLVPFASALPQAKEPEKPSIWQVNVDYSLSPEAEAESGLLGPQLGAIFGSYLVFIILVCLGILTLGRRLRRGAQSSPHTLNIEIVKPIQPVQPPTMQASSTNPWDPSPVSPTKSPHKYWPSPKQGSGWGSIRGKHSRKSSMQSSVVTFDDSVIEDDRNRNEIEMDRLYAAVAEHDAEQSKKNSVVTAQSTDAPLSPLGQHPPEFAHLRYHRAAMPEQYPLSPPPDSQNFPSRIDTTSPQERTSTKSPRRLNKPSPILVEDLHSRNSSRSSFASFGKRRGASIRNLPISPPMGSPDFNPENTAHYGDTEPLTPRHYNVPPPPLPPTPRNNQHEVQAMTSPQPGDDRKFHFHTAIRSSRGSVTSSNFSPGPTPRTATFPVSPPPVIREEQAGPPSINTGFNFALDPPSSGAGTPVSQKTTGSKSRSKPAPLTLGNAGSSSQSSLPLRTAPLPFRSLLSPRSQRNPYGNDIRAQEVTRPDKNRLAPGPQTAGLGSAVPQTPYSPYMPMTPMTPITPSRLVTREERKKMKKERGRRVLTEDDLVSPQEEMFGDGY